MTFNGKLTICGFDCTFELKDFILTVTTEIDNFLGWNNLQSILDNSWLHLNDYDSNVLHLKVDGIDYLGNRKYCYKIAGYIATYTRYNPDSKRKDIQPFSFEHIIIRNDILDYFFRHDKIYAQSAGILLQDWVTDTESTLPHCNRQPYSVIINNLEYTMRIHVMIQGSDTPFPFSLNNAIDIYGKESNDVEELWNIANTMRSFLKFISQSPSVNFEKDIYVYTGDDINHANTFLYLRPEKKHTVYPKRVLEFDDLKDNIGELINLIGANKIYFRSLFCTDADLISYSDIMNVCAAFESQYLSLYGDFKDKNKSTVKKKMLKLITDNADSFTGDELSYYQDILSGFQNYRDSLKQRLESALSEFIEIYGEFDTKYTFEKDYENMPTRIKDARNALDHGNVNHTLSYNTYWDSELVRAITYMLILKQANVPNAKIKNCLKKLSMFAM